MSVQNNNLNTDDKGKMDSKVVLYFESGTKIWFDLRYGLQGFSKKMIFVNNHAKP